MLLRLRSQLIFTRKKLFPTSAGKTHKHSCTFAMINRGHLELATSPISQTMEYMTAHDRRTTFLAIRLYHVIYTMMRTGSRWCGSPTCSTSSLRKRLDRQWVPLKYLKYLLNGLRWDIPPQRIWNFHIILHSLWPY